jgi:hypothetical protein
MRFSSNADSPMRMERPMKSRTSGEKVSILFGCMDQTAVFRSRGRGMAMPERKTWRHACIVPEHNHQEDRVACPFCHKVFQIRVYSESKARRRKIGFAAAFFAVAAGAIALGALAGRKTAFMGAGLAAPFLIFAVWQGLNVIRRRFDPGDIVSHARGKVHRIYNDRQIIFSD